MGRTKRKTNASQRVTMSQKEEMDFKQRNGNMSMMAAAANNLQNLPQTSSTPINNTKRRLIIKKFIREEQKNKIAFLTAMNQKLESYITTMAMLKLSLPASVLKRKLISFPFYRDNFSNGAIEDVNVEEDVSDNTAGPSNSSSDAFKKPELPCNLTVNQRPKRVRASSVRTPLNPIPLPPSVITPKVNMNRPLSVIRHAVVGETAVSLSGSPVLVTSVPRNDIPSISVPSNDGKVVTVFPISDFHMNEMPVVDENMRQPLTALYNILALMVNDNNDNI